MTNDPNSWNDDGHSLKVGDVFTEEWLDRFRSLMTEHNRARNLLRVAICPHANSHEGATYWCEWCEDRYNAIR